MMFWNLQGVHLGCGMQHTLTYCSCLVMAEVANSPLDLEASSYTGKPCTCLITQRCTDIILWTLCHTKAVHNLLCKGPNDMDMSAHVAPHMGNSF